MVKTKNDTIYVEQVNINLHLQMICCCLYINIIIILMISSSIIAIDDEGDLLLQICRWIVVLLYK